MTLRRVKPETREPGLHIGGMFQPAEARLASRRAWAQAAGLRPSTGRYAQTGIVPLSHSRDTAGPMARTVEDMILLDRVITGEAPSPARDTRGIRLGLPRTHFWEDLDAETAAETRAALDRLRGCRWGWNWMVPRARMERCSR